MRASAGYMLHHPPSVADVLMIVDTCVKVNAGLYAGQVAALRAQAQQELETARTRPAKKSAGK